MAQSILEQRPPSSQLHQDRTTGSVHSRPVIPTLSTTLCPEANSLSGNARACIAPTLGPRLSPVSLHVSPRISRRHWRHAVAVGAAPAGCRARAAAAPRGRAGEDVRRTESRTIAVARPVERVCRDRPQNRRRLRVVWKACVASHVHVHVHAASRRTLRLPPRTLPHEHDQHHRYRQKILSTRPRPLNGRHQHNGARPTLAPRPYTTSPPACLHARAARVSWR